MMMPMYFHLDLDGPVLLKDWVPNETWKLWLTAVITFIGCFLYQGILTNNRSLLILF